MSKERVNKECSKCLKEKNVERDFYLASSDLISSDHRMTICKDCLFGMVNMKDPESLANAMRAVDRPFMKGDYDDAITKDNPFGYYMRMLGTRQNRYRTYLDSDFQGALPELEAEEYKDNKEKVYSAEEMVRFKVTPDLILKWGDGLNESDIYQLESFYNSMMESNSIETPQHIESLKLLCKVNLAQNKALNEGSITEFKNLNMQYNVVLKDSGLRPIDRQSGGESSGIRSFSQIWEEIEKDGFIPKHNVDVTQDIVDKTIMYTENYTRRLLNAEVLSEPPKDTPKVDELDEL